MFAIRLGWTMGGVKHKEAIPRARRTAPDSAPMWPIHRVKQARRSRVRARAPRGLRPRSPLGRARGLAPAYRRTRKPDRCRSADANLQPARLCSARWGAFSGLRQTLPSGGGPGVSRARRTQTGQRSARPCRRRCRAQGGLGCAPARGTRVIIARIGGDEFVVLSWIMTEAAAIRKAAALEKAIYATAVRWDAST